MSFHIHCYKKPGELTKTGKRFEKLVEAADSALDMAIANPGRPYVVMNEDGAVVFDCLKSGGIELDNHHGEPESEPAKKRKPAKKTKKK